MSYDGRARSKQMCAGYAVGGMPRSTGGKTKIGGGKSPARGPRMPVPLAPQQAAVPPMAAATPGMQPVARGGRVKRALGGGVTDKNIDLKADGNLTIQTGGARVRREAGGRVSIDRNANAIRSGRGAGAKAGAFGDKPPPAPSSPTRLNNEDGNESGEYDGRARGGAVGVGPDVAGASRRKLAQEKGTNYARGGMPKRKGC